METYYGQVKTPQDAIVLLEACRLGILPRVQRRLSERERTQITSGSIFVWDEREAGMRRWTDGKSWSASRVSGSFLTYREMEGRRGAGKSRNMFSAIFSEEWRRLLQARADLLTSPQAALPIKTAPRKVPTASDTSPTV